METLGSNLIFGFGVGWFMSDGDTRHLARSSA